MKVDDCDRRGAQSVSWDRFDFMLCRLLGAIHLALGFVVFVGGVSRFPPPNYLPLLHFTGGRAWPYAVAWCVGGLFMLAGYSSSMRVIGLLVSIFITNLWAALFGVAAWSYDNAAFTASVAYGGYGLLSALLLGMMVVHARPIVKGG